MSKERKNFLLEKETVARLADLSMALSFCEGGKVGMGEVIDRAVLEYRDAHAERLDYEAIEILSKRRSRKDLGNE